MSEGTKRMPKYASRKFCGSCAYFSLLYVGDYYPCCNLYLRTGKHRTQENCAEAREYSDESEEKPRRVNRDIFYDEYEVLYGS